MKIGRDRRRVSVLLEGRMQLQLPGEEAKDCTEKSGEEAQEGGSTFYTRTFLNWLISKPGEKLWFAPVTTMALHAGFWCAAWRLSNKEASTARRRALKKMGA